MNHPSEEDLVLNYYAEGNNRSETERHLGACEACRALYDSVENTLKRMDALAVPEPVSDFEARVWQRLLPELPLPKFPLLAPAWRWVAAGAALAFMLGLAFLAGRHYPEPAKRIPAVGNPESRESLLEVAVGDHLERSQMVLTELANTSSSGPLDISFEQARAADLLGENRLYRQTALGAGDARTRFARDCARAVANFAGGIGRAASSAPSRGPSIQASCAGCQCPQPGTTPESPMRSKT